MKIYSRFGSMLMFVLMSTSVGSFGDEANKGKSEGSMTNITRAVILLKKCKPTSYPVESIMRGEQGVTQVKILIDTTGVAKEVLILKSSGFDRLDSETIKYFYSCKYSPATENSVPINVWQTFEYTWRVERTRPSTFQL